MRGLAWAAGLLLGVVVGIACGDTSECLIGSQGCDCTAGGSCDPSLTCVDGTCVSIECSVGSEGCPCTGGGACDPGLVCSGNLCVDEDGTSGPPPTTNDPTTGPSSDTDPIDDTTGGGVLLDVGADETGGNCVMAGCTKVDMLFALDSSLSMGEEINALIGTGAFSAIVQDLEDLNCGGIEYRIGLTNDNDGGFIGWGGTPWFDSGEMTPEEIAAAFSGAGGTVLGNGGTAIGCEHVLSSALSALALDTTGFLRTDALLVLVLITDVDDYGYYDQQGFGGPCDGFLCTEPFQPIQTIYDQLVTLKGGDPAGLAAIVVSGDPNVTAGLNTCQQPASCCGGGIECGQAHHSPRLWDFAALMEGTNGFTGDLCMGAAQVPLLIQQALSDNIDLACQTYEPPG